MDKFDDLNWAWWQNEVEADATEPRLYEADAAPVMDIIIARVMSLVGAENLLQAVR